MITFFNRALIITSILVLVGLTSIAQLIVTNKKELEIGANYKRPSVISVGVNGVVLLTESHEKKSENKKNIYLKVFDSRLTEKAEVSFSVPFKAELVQHITTDNQLFLLYNTLSKEQVFAYKLDLRDLKLQNSIYYSLAQVRYYESVAIRNKLFVAGVKGKKGILLRIDFDKNQSKISPILEENIPAFVQHLKVIDNNIYASIKSSDSHDTNLYYRVINQSNNVVESGVVEAPKNMRVLEGRFAKNNVGAISIVGTYANKKSVSPMGYFHSDLHQKTTFSNFVDISELKGLSLIDKKQKIKQESKYYMKLNDLYFRNGDWLAVLELYDIVEENKASEQVNNMLVNNDNFLKMWVINNLNYHDYNIHIFQRRIEDVAAYQFKGAYLLKVNNKSLTNLDMHTDYAHKSFGNLTSYINSEGNLQVIDKYSGDVRKLDVDSKGNLFHQRNLIDRDGNHLTATVTNAYFWKDRQYLFTSISERKKGNYAITFLKVKS